MIGLLDLIEPDRAVLADIATGRLVWYPTPPEALGAFGVAEHHSVWVWTDTERGHPLAVASLRQVAAVYVLQRAGLVTATRPGHPVRPTAAGARLVAFLNAEGWQPPDRRLIAIAATTRKAATRARKRRLA